MQSLEAPGPEISIVVPMYNEEKSVLELHARLTEVLTDLRRSYEIVFVNDCSKDGTFELLKRVSRQDPCVVLVDLLSNFGQTAAIAAGIELAAGEIIIPMDGDLQHAPEDIPAFVAQIDVGYDIVSGWREKRVDAYLSRRLPSKIANKLMARLSGIPLQDFGTTFKAYRRDLLKGVNLYGEFHRFVPVLIREKFRNVRITEIPIQNIVRPHGESNYGIGRTFTVLFDLIRLKFLMTFRHRPLQLFGAFGFILACLGLSIWVFFLAARIFYGKTITSDLGFPLFLVSLFLIIAGLQTLFFGLIGELLVKNHFDSPHVKVFAIRNVFRHSSRGD